MPGPPSTTARASVGADPGEHPAPPAPAPGASPGGGRAPIERWLPLAGAVVAVALVLLGLARLASKTWYPIGDFAQAELRMFSFWNHPPLVGAAGRIADLDLRQGNHPGPLMWWMLWPTWKSFGGSSWAFNVACGVSNLIGGGVAILLGRRIAGRRGAAGVAAAVALLVAAFGPDVILQPWNPSLPLLWFLVFLVAVWGVLCGHRLHLLVAVFAGTYCVQSHAGYLPMVLALGGAATLATLLVGRRARHRDGRAAAEQPDDEVEEAPGTPAGVGAHVHAAAARLAAHPWLVIVAAGLLGLLLWSPVLYQAATGDRSNLVILWHSFGHPDAPYVGLPRAVRLVLLQFDPISTLVRSKQVVGGFPYLGLLMALVWAGLAAWSWKQAPAALRRLQVLLAATTVLAIASVSRIFGTVLLYLFGWSWVITVLVLLATAWSAWILVGDAPGPRRRVRRLAPAALVVLALLVAAVGGGIRYADVDVSSPRFSRTVGAITPRLSDQLDRSKTYLVEWDDPVALGGIGFGVLLDLERRGFDVSATQPFSAAAEPHRIRTEAEVDAVLHVVTGPVDIARWRATPGAKELLYVDIRTPAETARAKRAHDQLVAELKRQGRTDLVQQADKGPVFPLFLDESLPEATRHLVAEQIEYFPGTAVFETKPTAP